MSTTTDVSSGFVLDSFHRSVALLAGFAGDLFVGFGVEYPLAGDVCEPAADIYNTSVDKVTLYPMHQHSLLGTAHNERPTKITAVEKSSKTIRPRQF